MMNRLRKYNIKPILVIYFAWLIFYTPAISQVPAWNWAVSAGGTNSDRGYDIATDFNGNIIATGSFESSSISFGAITLNNSGGSDVFITKYDPSGNVLWAKAAGGASYEVGNSCAADANGNIFITGYFHSQTIAFGNIVLVNAGSVDMFIVKYDPSGNVIWAKSAGGILEERGVSCSTDPFGNIIVTGHYINTPITFGSITLPSAFYEDIFIVKYDAAGNVIWAKSNGGLGYDKSADCTTDSNGNIIITGEYSSQVINFNGTVIANSGSRDIFIAKYDSSGNILWAKSIGGADYDAPYSCATDLNNNIIVTGYFNSSTFYVGSNSYNCIGSGDIFIIKYDSNGNLLWVNTVGTVNEEYTKGCATDMNGNIIITGMFSGTSINFGSTNLVHEGSGDIFVVKYDTNGNTIWAKSAGGSNNEVATACETDLNGNVFITGFFRSSPLNFGSYILNSANSVDIFVAEIDSSSVSSGITIFSDNDFTINVSPNPTSNNLNIRVNSNVNEIEIYSVLGESILHLNYSPNIDISNLDNGLYLLKVIGNDHVFYSKFIKE